MQPSTVGGGMNAAWNGGGRAVEAQLALIAALRPQN